MRDLTEADKKEILSRIYNLGPEHWEKVKQDVAAENEEFIMHQKSLSVSCSKLRESFDI